MVYKIVRLVFVLILVAGLISLTTPAPARAAGPWYVAATGDNNNDCLSPATPCSTIDGAIGKASSGDTVYVAAGDYTGSGGAVVSVDKNITLAGGWDSGFSTQSSFSTIDGQDSIRGVYITTGVLVSLDHFIIRNGFVTSYGAGIYSDGDLIIRNSSIHNNSIGNFCYGGGIFFNGTSMSIENSTVSNNSAGCNGGGVFSAQIPSTVNINNSTISNNQGGGLYNNGTFNLNNSIISGNGTEDCNGTPYTSLGNNIIGNTANCTITAVIGDQFNVDPLLGSFLTDRGYSPLLLGSPAIDAGNDSTCLNVDQRGVTRPQGASCDIGAYERTASGPAVGISLAGGDHQRTQILTAFANALEVAALDGQGSPVSGVAIDFSAPASGPSGTFAGTGTSTTSVNTDADGYARTILTANDQAGSYTVSATAAGLGTVIFDHLEQFVAPANDNFSNAESINSLPFSGMVDNTEASAEPGEPQDCSALGRSVWYSFAPTQAMTLRVDMSGSPVSGVVGLYLASGPAISDLTSLGCVYSGSSFNFQVGAGQTYYLRVDSFSQAGNLQVNLQQIIPPANDNFASAAVITSLPFSASVDNANATSEPGEGSNCFFLDRTVWYSFTPSADMTIQLDTNGSAVGSMVSLYLASGPGISDLTFLTCTGNGSATNIHVEAGKTYYLQLDGDIGQTGVLQLNLKQVFPPANDNFANPQTISGLPFSATADAANATFEADESQLQSCGSSKGTVWYSFTPAENITARVDMVGSSGSGNIDIYLSSGPALSDLTSLACASSNSSANIQFAMGKTYYLRVDGAFGQAGTLQINLTQIVPPANDSFAGAEAIPALPFHVAVDNTNASLELGEPQGCGFPFRSLWYSFNPAENMAIRMNTVGSAVSGNVSLYLASGPSISDLTVLTCTGGDSSTKFQVEAGKTYYVRVDSFGQAGTIQVNLVPSIPPANDNFASAQAITALPLNATVDITDATSEPDEPQFCVSMPNTAWYSFTATETEKFRIDTQGSSVSANVNVYQATGNGFAGLQFVQCSGLGGAASFVAEAGGTYYFQVGGFGQDGTAQFNLTPMAAISGRITDAVTGAPLAGNIEPFAAAQLYRICGDGCLEFVNSLNADADGRFAFDSYYYGSPLPSGTYQITATASLYQTRQFAPFEFSGSNLDVGDLPLSPPAVIRGGVVASDTGSPLPNASVTLRSCNDSGCFDYVNSQNTDSAGQFQFNSFSYGAPLPGGVYELEISATLYETRHIGVTIGDGENRDLGNLSLTPVPLIGSISGRLIDAVTGKPIAAAFRPELDLYRCEGGGCSLINLMLPDAQGRFRFETDFSGIHLAAGSYKITAFAEQYSSLQTDIFDVGEKIDYSVADIKLKSVPVRFSDVQPCTDIPASGGDCIFTVKISNGTDKNLTGKTWSLVYSALPGSLAGFTNFQIKDPQDVSLGRGQSKVFRFRFSVPANPGPYGSSICPRIFVGQGSQPIFNTVGFNGLFCIFRNASGFTVTAPGEDVASAPANIPVAATATEIEPNNSCQTAQDAGAVSGPFVMDGNLDSSGAPDVDFFRFSGTPGSIVAVDEEGQSTGKGTLENPLLGLFDSNCNLLTLNDDSGNFNSHLDITVPEDGVFILAATAYPDFGFTGGGNGSYQLTVTPPQFINSISGVITDALNGKPLRGDAAPFAFVRLLRCDVFGCNDVNSQSAGSDGSFLFATESGGAALRVGNYRIIASADQYQMTETEMFGVGEGKDYNTGPIALNSYPIRFSETQVCKVPAQGGLCTFSVKVTNGLPKKFSGKVWSIIDADNIGSFTNFTSFQADTLRDITLGSGKSTVLQFRFMVRGSVANGASICATIFAGQNPSPFFNAVGERFLFCIVKGETGFSLMSEQEMQSQLQHMQVQEVAPVNPPSLKKTTK